jgi:hypothetical protein
MGVLMLFSMRLADLHLIAQSQGLAKPGWLDLMFLGIKIFLGFYLVNKL